MAMTNTAAITTNKADIPDAVARTAVEWLLAWQMADEPSHIWLQICQWRQANCIHEQAWQHIENINSQLACLAQSGTSHIAHQTISSPHTSRRQALKVLSVFIVVSGSSWLLARQQPWQHWTTDHYTGIGQQLRLTLEDGSEVFLNSSSAINIQFTATQRRIVLVKGEVYINSGKDNFGQSQFNNARPLVVEFAQGQAKPIGTRFAVRQFNNHCKVSVYQGKVQLQGSNVSHTVIVNAGKQRTFNVDNDGAEHYGASQSVSESEAAWTQGMIVASDMRLQDFLNELSRHKSGIIQCAPKVADLKVSGTYPLKQVDKVLQSLTAALPIKISTFSRYWLRVLPTND